MSNVILYLIFSVEEKSINKYLQKKVTSCIFSLYSQLILFAGILISVSGRISENCINFTLSFLEILFIEIRNSYGEPYLCLILDHFFIFQKNSLHLKMANFSSLKRRSIFTSRKILREKLELHSASKKSLNIAKMVEKRFELPVSTHDLAYEKIRLADCHKIPIFSDKSENPHARVTGVHKFLTFTPPSVPVDNREASHQEMKPL